jgi:hypothetical protein
MKIATYNVNVGDRKKLVHRAKPQFGRASRPARAGLSDERCNWR